MSAPDIRSHLFGDSNGDREMLEWTGAGAGMRLKMIGDRRKGRDRRRVIEVVGPPRRARDPDGSVFRRPLRAS
jgi:hypothetical protein